LVPSSQLETFHKNEIQRQKKEIEGLKEELRSSVKKRRSLIAQADAADRQAAKTKEFMLRAFLALMPHLDSGKGRHLKNIFSKIRDLLKQRAPLRELDAAFQQLKDGTLMDGLEEPEEASPVEKKSGFSLFKRAPAEPESPVEGFKNRYLKIIGDLKSFLDHADLKELSEIEERLKNTLESYDLVDVQKELKKLLKSYVYRVGIEREEVAGFILEIGERLSEIELKFLHCSTSFQENGKAASLFTAAVEQEITSLQDAVDITKNLDELKSKVMGSIGQIKSAIVKKRNEEWKYAQQSEEQVAQLNENIKQMQLEIASAKKRTTRLESEILTDPLTSIHSRRAYELLAEKEWKRYQQDRRGFSLLLLNVDNFKLINERYGHDVGDICLKGLAKRIRALLEKGDFLARFEGNSFAVILPGAPAQAAQKTAEKIRGHIEKTNFIHKKEQVRVTLSIGAAEVGPADNSAGDLFGRVEKALFLAKEGGRNRVVLA